MIGRSTRIRKASKPPKGLKAPKTRPKAIKHKSSWDGKKHKRYFRKKPIGQTI